MLAQVQQGSLFAAGNIDLAVDAYSVVRTSGSTPPAATITLNGATLEGNAIDLTANASEREGEFGFDKQATAKVDIGSSTIVGNSVNITSYAERA